MAALEMLIGGTCILTSASVHVNTMYASKLLVNRNCISMTNIYIYTDNSQLIKGGQFKLGPAPIKCHLINSVLPSKVKGGPIYQGLPHNTKIRNEEECIWCVQGFSISIHLNHVQAMGKLAYSGWFNYLIKDGSVF